ncbi:MAG: peptidylprolyl isomerase [Candidatus Doudnabacteria bacterium]|nr:peptidylprolyl isomerase [Candidatus Doudnabacteria bacterium]
MNNNNNQTAGYSQEDINKENKQVTEPTPTPTPAPASSEAPARAIVKIETSEGAFKVALDGTAAPLTVNNFIKLANEGFYEGLTFHRIVEGFMIQGGDPQGDGTGGPGYTIPAEIKLKHTKGAIAMARTGDQINPKKESSGSQFYVTLDAQPFLDGQYTVFGYVSEGMNVVEKIGKTPVEPNPMTGETSVPLKEVKILKVTVEETE